MVDAGDVLTAGGGRILFVQSKRPQQAAGGNLDRVAEPDHADRRPAEHAAGEHRHGVRVVQHPRRGADRLHLVREIEHHRQRAQGAEDAADAEGVGDGLAQSVFFRNFEIDDGARVIPADLDRVDDVIRPLQRFASVGGAEIAGDPGPVLVDVAVQRVQHLLGFAQAAGVDVVEGDVGVAQRFGEHGVAQHILGEHRAPRTHERDLRHSPIPLAGESWCDSIALHCARSRTRCKGRNVRVAAPRVSLYHCVLWRNSDAEPIVPPASPCCHAPLADGCRGFPGGGHGRRRLGPARRRRRHPAAEMGGRHDRRRPGRRGRPAQAGPKPPHLRAVAPPGRGPGPRPGLSLHRSRNRARRRGARRRAEPRAALRGCGRLATPAAHDHARTAPATATAATTRTSGCAGADGGDRRTCAPRCAGFFPTPPPPSTRGWPAPGRIGRRRRESTRVAEAAEGATLLVYHPSWGHFAAAYGLRQRALEADGKTPSARHLAELATGVRREGVRTLFSNPDAPEAVVRRAAATLGCRVEVIDPLAGAWDENLLRTASRMAAGIAPEARP